MNKICTILKDWKDECHDERVLQFKYSYYTGILTICTYRVGVFIGRAGCLVSKYKEILQREVTGFKDVNFIETDSEVVI